MRQLCQECAPASLPRLGLPRVRRHGMFVKAIGSSDKTQLTMLADRFRLVTHRETRRLPIYVLSVAKGGIKPHQGDGSGGMSSGPRLIRNGSGTMGELARQLSGLLGRNVIDRTGLTGQYAISLSFAPVDPVRA